MYFLFFPLVSAILVYVSFLFKKKKWDFGITFLGCFLSFARLCSMSLRSYNTERVFNLNFLSYFEVNDNVYHWGFFFTKTESFLCAFIVSLILCGLLFTKAFYKDAISHKYYIFFSLMTFFVTLGIGANQFIQFFTGFEAVILLTYLMMIFINEQKSAQKTSGKFFISHLFSDVFILFAFYMIINQSNSFYIPPYIFDQKVDFDETQQILFGLFLLLGIGGKMLQFFSFCNEKDLSICADFVILSVVLSVIFAGYSVYILLNLFDFCKNVFVVKFLFVLSGVVTSFLYGLKGIYKVNLKEKIYSILSMQMGVILILFAIAEKDTCVRSYVAISVPTVGMILSLGALNFALQGELDINKMGELSREYPTLFWICSLFVLCLIGFPGLGTFCVWQDLFASIYIRFSIYHCIPFILFLFVMGWIFSDLLYKIFFSKRNICVEKVVSLQKIDKGMIFPIVLLLLCTVFQDQIFQQSVLEHLSKKQSIYVLVCSLLGCSGICFGLLFFKMNGKLSFVAISNFLERKFLLNFLTEKVLFVFQQHYFSFFIENLKKITKKNIERIKNLFEKVLSIRKSTVLIMLIFLGLTLIIVQRLYLCNF